MKDLSERDICSKFITPALSRAGWDLQTQILEEKTLTAGRVIVRGRMVARGKTKRADYVLFAKPNIPIAVVEAKDANHSVGDGIQQAVEYAEMLRVPFAFSSNGTGFVFHDRTGQSTYCTGCGTLLIERNWYQLGAWRLDENGRCQQCGTPLAGHYDSSPGDWGARRLPIRL